jgi:hypothetical protein
MTDVTITSIEDETYRSQTNHLEHGTILQAGLPVIAAFLIEHREELRARTGELRWAVDAIAEALRVGGEGPGNGPHSAAAASGALPEGSGQPGGFGGVEDPRGVGCASARPPLTNDDVPWLRLAIDHAILNDETARFAHNALGTTIWVLVEDAARIAATWIKDSLCVGGAVCGQGARTAAGCICDAEPGQFGHGLLCPIHGDPISRKNLRGNFGDELEKIRQEVRDMAAKQPGPSIRRGGLQFEIDPGLAEAFKITHQPDLSENNPYELCGNVSPLGPAGLRYGCTRAAGHEADWKPGDDVSALNHTHPDTDMMWRSTSEKTDDGPGELKDCG